VNSIRVSQDEPSTPVGLMKIGWFAAAAFLLMTAMVQPSWRGVPLVIGGGIVVALVVAALWLRYQERFGSATLAANTFTAGERFEGVIETELRDKPASPVSICLLGQDPQYQSAIAFRIGDEVPPERMELAADGTLRIPFSLLVPGKDSARRAVGVRLIVRTKQWPLGWGATFLIVPVLW
jgi:hypothetical protein